LEQQIGMSIRPSRRGRSHDQLHRQQLELRLRWDADPGRISQSIDQNRQAGEGPALRSTPQQEARRAEDLIREELRDSRARTIGPDGRQQKEAPESK